MTIGDNNEQQTSPVKGDFIVPPETEEDERADVLPQQEEFWRPPLQFGSVPVEKEPLRWDKPPTTWSKQLGWESIYAYNKEGFGSDSLLVYQSEYQATLAWIIK